MGGWVSA